MAPTGLCGFWNEMLMITFTGITLGMFGISILQLVLATALPCIVTEIGGDFLYSWIFSSYMLASLLTIPVFRSRPTCMGTSCSTCSAWDFLRAHS
jgi:hypothetical protein